MAIMATKISTKLHKKLADTMLPIIKIIIVSVFKINKSDFLSFPFRYFRLLSP